MTVILVSESINTENMEEEVNIKPYSVLFWGNYIPLQGTQYIIRAAASLCDRSRFRFTMIGDGQTHDETVTLARTLKAANVRFIGRLPIEELPRFIADADICLGIFGDTNKAARVIPNKAYETIAMRKPLISADTPAMRELFVDRQNILFCRRADSEDLADKIALLRADAALRERIAVGGHELFLEKCTPRIIGESILSFMRPLI